jgi:hypothetical protein
MKEGLAMNVEIKPFYALPCSTEVFTINGIDADTDYFGHSEDTERGNTAPYGCGCRKFIGDDDRMSEAMEKYGITANEFYEVQDMLVSELHVGGCGLCI